MALLRIILFCSIMPLLLAPGRPTTNVSEHRIFEQGGALFENIGDGSPPEKLSDMSHCEKVEGNGSVYYAILRSNGRRTWLTILECDANGVLRTFRTVANKRLRPVTAIMSESVLDDGTVSVILHVDPTTSVAVTLDMTTGRQTILESTISE